MPDLRTRANIIADMIKEIEEINSVISTMENEVLHDISIGPVATETEKLYRFFDYVRLCATYDGLLYLIQLTDTEKVTLSTCFAEKADGSAYTADEVDDIIGDDVENYASNFGITRDPGAKATGYVRFYRRDDSTMTIYAGTQVETAAAPAIQFQTTESLENQAPTYDSEEGLYYVTIPVEALEYGTAGNVVAGKISVINPPLPGVAIRCKNVQATSGGADEESNASLLARTRFAWGASNLNTIEGYTSFVEQQSGVSDALVITPDDSRMVRAVAGAVDIWVASSETLTARTQRITYQSGTTNYVLDHQPVSSVTSVTDTITGTPLSASDYELVKDTGVNRASTSGQDGIRFLTSLGHGREYEIVYAYDAQIATLQALFSQEAYDIVDDDVQVKKGIEVPIIVQAQFSVFPEIESKASVESEIESLLLVYFAGGSYGNTVFTAKSLGGDVVSTDIRSTILSHIRGIDRLETTNWSVARSGAEHEDTISIEYYEYARLGEFDSV